MDRLLDIVELSEILGVTKATIYSWTSQNKIPYIKLSKRLLKFKEDEIMAWIAQKSISADTPLLMRKKGKSNDNLLSSSDDYIERIINSSKEEIFR